MNRLFYICLLFLLSACELSNQKTKTYRNLLKIPKTGFEFKLYQRSHLLIPSDANNVYCYIDDITLGQTHLTLKEDSIVLLDQSIHDAEHATFSLRGIKYTLECKQLVNLLIGNDYGFFVIKSVDVVSKIEQKDESKKIEALLIKIEQSNVLFIRNGTSYTPKEAADHLRSKWEQNKDHIKTQADFIEKIASYSSYSGKTYEVKLNDGTVLTANKWLKGL